jgi:hypothetical protein
MRMMEGRVISIQGDMASVKMRNGKVKLVETSKLRLHGEKSDITKFVDALAGRDDDPYACCDECGCYLHVTVDNTQVCRNEVCSQYDIPVLTPELSG